MKYKRNFLTKVIFQLRFEPIPAIEEYALEPFKSQVADSYPRVETGEEVTLRMVTPKGGIIPSPFHEVRKRWTFFGKDNTSKLIVAPVQFALEYDRYQDSTALKADFDFTWSKFSAEYKVGEFERVGLRYINEIVLPEGNPFDWDGYINKNLVAATLTLPEPSNYKNTRSMHFVRWMAEDHAINFNFGIHNRDYPNPIARKEFILDYDCYSIEPIEAYKAAQCLGEYNKVVEGLFEASIGERLRKVMRRPMTTKGKEVSDG